MTTNERYWRVEAGDVLSTLASMGDNSFDGLFMDSPYGLTFMEKKWDEALPSVEVCRKLLRVAKPGAMLLAFGSPRTFHRLACHLEDAGWQIRDCLMWLHAQGFPKSHNIGKAIDKKLGAIRKVVGTKPNPHRGVLADHQYRFQPPDKPVEITAPATPEAASWDGYGTALKPAWEPILMAMKPLEGIRAIEPRLYLYVAHCPVDKDDDCSVDHDLKVGEPIMAKKMRRGQKQCPECKKWIKGTRVKTCPKCGHAFMAAKPNGAAKPAPAVVEAPSAKPATTVTLDQIKAVGQMVNTIGGFRRLHEMLGVIKEVGGVKKFKDLLEAMAIPETDAIPF